MHQPFPNDSKSIGYFHACSKPFGLILPKSHVDGNDQLNEATRKSILRHRTRARSAEHGQMKLRYPVYIPVLICL